MKIAQRFAGTACLLYAGLMGSPALAQSRIDAAASAYLVSPQFTEVLVSAVRSRLRTLECTGPRIHLDEIVASQEIVMAGGAHPESGLWWVKFEAEGCVPAQQHSVLLRANPGGAPVVLPLPAEMHVRLRGLRAGGQSGP